MRTFFTLVSLTAALLAALGTAAARAHAFLDHAKSVGWLHGERRSARSCAHVYAKS